MMKIRMTITLDMDDTQMHSWAHEYGLDMDEVASDASEHIGDMVREHVENISQVRDFATITRFAVK